MFGVMQRLTVLLSFWFLASILFSSNWRWLDLADFPSLLLIDLFSISQVCEIHAPSEVGFGE